MKKFQSSKLIDGFSTCYRNHKSPNQTAFLHGTDLKFRVYFEGEMDHRNWVADFGLFKRAKNTIQGMSPKDYFSYMFDHTCLISTDDPYLPKFQEMGKKGIIQLRTLENTSEEGISKHLHNVLSKFIYDELEGRVTVSKIDVII
jgi:6-pyruvoyltetrahydropterin/6-carboxytetrahydropterin synthase